jgi:hypothetical protein
MTRHVIPVADATVAVNLAREEATIHVTSPSGEVHDIVFGLVRGEQIGHALQVESKQAHLIVLAGRRTR